MRSIIVLLRVLRFFCYLLAFAMFVWLVICAAASDSNIWSAGEVFRKGILSVAIFAVAILLARFFDIVEDKAREAFGLPKRRKRIDEYNEDNDDDY